MKRTRCPVARRALATSPARHPRPRSFDGSANPQPAVAFTPGSSRAAIRDGFTVTGGSNPGSLAANTGGGIRIGLHLPLNLDQVTFALTSFAGGLNGSGQGSVVFPLGSLFLPRSLIGQQISTAAAIIGPGPVLSAFTNDENVTLVQ